MHERIPVSPPFIEPVASNYQRPLWSVMIPVYNCSHFLQGTLESVLAQGIGVENMQIEVVDDGSTDANVEALVHEIGKGRVQYYRQVKNVGSLRNFETCINRSTGLLIHLLHGDDQVKPGFYTAITQLFDEYPAAGAAITGFSGMDEKDRALYHNKLISFSPGIIDDWLIKIAENQRIQACAVVVKRSVYEEVGGYYGVEYGEDWEMWVRIAAKFPVAYTPENLALYRHHPHNISSRFSSTGKNIQDITTVIETIQNYLPVEKRKAVKIQAKRYFANYFTGKAQGIYRQQGNARVALKQAWGALLLHANQRTIISLIRLCAKVLIRYRGKN